MNLLRKCLPLLFGTVFAAAPALAEDQLLPGHKLSLHIKDGRERLAWTVRDPAAVPPPAGSADDPTTAGATLSLISSTGASASLDMPAASWSASNGKYRFKQRGDSDVPPLVRAASVQDGALRVRALDTGIELGDPAPAWVGVILTIGATRYCTLFDSHIRRAEPGRFDAAKVPAPAACPAESAGSVTWRIEDGPDEQAQTLAAFFAAADGDTIEFGEGAFEFRTTLLMAHREGITIRGQGSDRTVLDFLGSNTPEGISLSHMTGITIEDLTIIDTPGFSLKVSDSDYVVLRNMRAMWSSADSNPLDGVDDRGGMDPKLPATLDVTCVHELSFPESTGTYTDANGLPRTYVTDSGNGGYAIYPCFRTTSCSTTWSRSVRRMRVFTSVSRTTSW